MFKNSERAYLREKRALVTDDQGNECLVGLTTEETAFFVRLAHAAPDGDFPSRSDIARYLKLQARHEESRLIVVGAQCQSRTRQPPSQ